MCTFTQAISEIQDNLELSGDKSWSEGKHLRACGKWALMGVLDVPAIFGTTLLTLIAVATVESKFKK